MPKARSASSGLPPFIASSVPNFLGGPEPEVFRSKFRWYPARLGCPMILPRISANQPKGTGSSVIRGGVQIAENFGSSAVDWSDTARQG